MRRLQQVEPQLGQKLSKLPCGEGSAALKAIDGLSREAGSRHDLVDGEAPTVALLHHSLRDAA